jgi:hypothetical protein
VELNLLRYDPRAIALNDGISFKTYGQLIEEIEVRASSLLNSDGQRYYLDGVTNLDAIQWMYAAWMSGKELFLLPSFIPAPIRWVLSAKFGALTNVSKVSLTDKRAASYPFTGRVSVLTSGTTGKPKMVAFATTAFTNVFNVCGLEEKVKVYTAAPMTAAPIPHLMSLSAGCETMIETDRFSAERASQADVVMTVPSSIEKVLPISGSIASIITATSPLSRAQEELCANATASVFDIYTSTETGIVATRDVYPDSPFTVFRDVAVDVTDMDSTGTGILVVESDYTMVGQYQNKNFVCRSNSVQNGDIVTVSDPKTILRVIRSETSKIKVSGFSVYLDLVLDVARRAPGVLDVKASVLRKEPDDEVTLYVKTNDAKSSFISYMQAHLPWYAMPKRTVFG